MEIYNNTACVTVGEITEVMSFDCYQKMLSRGNIRSARQGKGLGSYALIVWSSIPERYRVQFIEKYGDPEHLLKKDRETMKIEMDDKAREYYRNFRYDKGGEMVSLSEKHIREYTVNASVLGHLIRVVGERAAQRNALGGSSSHLWESVMGECERLRDLYNHTLPTNVQRLRTKANAFKKKGYDTLISGKVGNSNTLKITEEAAMQIIALKRSSVPVYTDVQILERFNEIAMERGWKQLKSIQSLKLFLERPDIEPLWYDAVYGETQAGLRYSRKQKTVLPSMRDSLWYGDGTKLNLYYKAKGKDGNWYMRTMQVYEVIDAYSEVFLGYYISETEDFEAQYNAYRMAIQISGHRPYELVHDNQGGHKKLDAERFFERISRVHRTTAPYSPQAKTIESVFGRFQSQVLHKDWRFTGQNITAKKTSGRPNMERILANVDKLYTLSELKAVYAKAREEWNNMAHPATGLPRQQMYNNSVNEETPEITVMDMVDIFWIWADRPSTYTSNGIKITIKKQTYTYEVFDSPGVPNHEFLRNNFGQKFHIKYDPYDFSSIRLYKADRSGELRYVTTAEPYMVVHRNIQEQADGEMAFIRSQIEANRQDVVARQSAAQIIECKHGVSMEQQGLNRPKIKTIDESSRREIERRVRKYSRVPCQSLGQIIKFDTNITDDQLDIHGDIEIPMKKIVGKL